MAPVPNLSGPGDHDGVVVQFFTHGVDDLHLERGHGLNLGRGVVPDRVDVALRPLAGPSLPAQFSQQVLQGQAAKWVYLYIHDDTVELRDAAHLLGKDTWETQDALQDETGYNGHQLSVYTSGVAGENKVRFAAIHGDYGHVASKNGCGAVMGAKRLKAVAIVRGSKPLRVHDYKGLYYAGGGSVKQENKKVIWISPATLTCEVA